MRLLGDGDADDDPAAIPAKASSFARNPSGVRQRTAAVALTWHQRTP